MGNKLLGEEGVENRTEQVETVTQKQDLSFLFGLILGCVEGRGFYADYRRGKEISASWSLCN